MSEREAPRGRNDLDLCPHSEVMYQHRWHGLPLKGCGGSHLDLDEAKRLAKPFEANDEKYPDYYPNPTNNSSLYLPYWTTSYGQ